MGGGGSEGKGSSFVSGFASVGVEVRLELVELRRRCDRHMTHEQNIDVEPVVADATVAGRLAEGVANCTQEGDNGILCAGSVVLCPYTASCRFGNVRVLRSVWKLIGAVPFPRAERLGCEV